MAEAAAELTSNDEPATNGSPQIFRLMGEIMRRIGHISKDRRAQFGDSYAYRGIDDVYQQVGPIMADLGVFCMPRVLSQQYEQCVNRSNAQEQRAMVHLELRFIAPDGSEVKGDFPGVGMDARDKAANKATSVAMREIIIKAFCIPLAGSEDSETDNTPAAPVPAAPQAPPPVERSADGKLRGTFTVKSVAVKKSGTSKFGKPYTLWSITTTDGQSFDTFRQESKELCERRIGQQVNIAYTCGHRGNTLEQVDDDVATQPPPAAATPPAEASPAPTAVEKTRFDVFVNNVSARVVNLANGGKVTVYDVSTNLHTFVTQHANIAADLKQIGESKHEVILLCHEVGGGKWHIDSYDEVPF